MANKQPATSVGDTKKVIVLAGIGAEITTLIQQLRASETDEAKLAIIVIDAHEKYIGVLQEELDQLKKINADYLLKLNTEASALAKVYKLEAEIELLEGKLEEKDEAIQEYKELNDELGLKLKTFKPVVADDSFEVDGKTYKLLFPSFQHAGEVIDISVLKQNAKIAREVVGYGTLTKEV